MDDMNQRISDAVKSGVMWGAAIALLLIFLIVVTGQTFGSRCAEVYHTQVEFDDCVARLSHGGSV